MRSAESWDAASRLAAMKTVPAVAVLLLLVATACGGTGSVPLADLALEQERYDGERVTTSGVVIAIGEDGGPYGRQYAIQDADANRVRLLPDHVAEPHVGSTVTVTGEFEYDPGQGRLLHAETIVGAG